MNETIKVLTGRRAVRKYLPRQVDKAALDQIVEAGRYAPSGLGRQACVMVVVQDQATRNQLSRMNAAVMGKTDIDPFYGAPTVIVVLENLDEIATASYDGPLMMGNLMNAATAVGVDSCWIHRAKEMFESEEGKELLKKWGLNGNYQGIGNCILGYHDGEYPQPKARREDNVIRIL